MDDSLEDGHGGSPTPGTLAHYLYHAEDDFDTQLTLGFSSASLTGQQPGSPAEAGLVRSKQADSYTPMQSLLTGTGFASQDQTQSRLQNDIMDAVTSYAPWGNSPYLPDGHLFDDGLAEGAFDAAAAFLSQPTQRGSDKRKRATGNDDAASVSCDSDCEGSCASQCGNTGHGVCCDDNDCAPLDACRDEACQGAVSPCTDANCITDALSGEQVAAATLASFGHEQLGPHSPCFFNHCDGIMSNSFPHDAFQDIMCNHDFTSCTNMFNQHAIDLPAFTTQGEPRTLADLISLDLSQLPDLESTQVHDSNAQAHVCPSAPDASDFSAFHCILPRHNNAYQEHVDTCNPAQIQTQPCCTTLQSWDGLVQHFLEQHKPIVGSLPLTGPKNTRANRLDSRSYSLASTPATNLSYGTGPMPTPMTPSTAVSMDMEQSAILASPDLMLPSPCEPSVHHVPQTPGVYTCSWSQDGGTTACNMTFESEEKLHKHCLQAHVPSLQKNEGIYWCGWGDCDKTTGFSQKSKLERHLQTHTGFKPEQCKICGKKLSGPQALEQHLRIHTGEMPWKCQFEGCNAGFKQQSALTMHVRTHTKDKPLVCEECGQKFAESSNLSKHRRTHQPPLYKCKLCPDSAKMRPYVRVDQLKRHAEKSHADVGQENITQMINAVKREVELMRRAEKESQRAKKRREATTTALS
ncbi:hypothetical protein B0I35DRAFT_404010 [Stachybotrys elegans]|uniref:C2H2-type domain-containing protein n=1 Tax=Stachybotrys elegans TaxID=80388 RepID=A0A8K0WWY8_9HYPO|nr:hypothetical protein B0I35DRAFT_404010 [Stachybotrys elegans]